MRATIDHWRTSDGEVAACAGPRAKRPARDQRAGQQRPTERVQTRVALHHEELERCEAAQAEQRGQRVVVADRDLQRPRERLQVGQVPQGVIAADDQRISAQCSEP
jgi:hypothetical protein